MLDLGLIFNYKLFVPFKINLLNMNIKEIAVIHNDEQGRVKEVWLENDCLFAQFVGRLCTLGRRVKFSELSFLNKKAQKRAQKIVETFSTKPKKTLPLKQVTDQARTLSASA